MNLEKIRFKKALKLITLLLTSLLIAGVSAATYYSMNINGTITVKTAPIIWVKGSNSNATITLAGDLATVTLSVVNGTAQNFTSCLYLKNQGSHAYSLNFTTITALSSASFSTAKVLIYTNSTETYTGNELDLTTTSTPSNGNSLVAGAAFSLVFDISTAASATGSYSFEVKVTYQ